MRFEAVVTQDGYGTLYSIQDDGCLIYNEERDLFLIDTPSFMHTGSAIKYTYPIISTGPSTQDKIITAYIFDNKKKKAMTDCYAEITYRGYQARVNTTGGSGGYWQFFNNRSSYNVYNTTYKLDDASVAENIHGAFVFRTSQFDINRNATLTFELVNFAVRFKNFYIDY